MKEETQDMSCCKHLIDSRWIRSLQDDRFGAAMVTFPYACPPLEGIEVTLISTEMLTQSPQSPQKVRFLISFLCDLSGLCVKKKRKMKKYQPCYCPPRADSPGANERSATERGNLGGTVNQMRHIEIATFAIGELAMTDLLQ